MRRPRTLRWVGVLVLGVNLALAISKGVVWYSTGSLALLSEALNSGVDTVYSAVVLIGLYLTSQPPDFEHPHGHERIEPFVSLFVAAGIFIVGGSVMFSAYNTLTGTETVGVGGPLALAVLAGSAGLKAWLYRYCLSIAEDVHSPAIVAVAMDNRADILTAMAAFIGVLGASLGYFWLDPVAAVVVAIGILYSGVGVVRDNLNYLVGAAPSEDLRNDILERALANPEVKGAHDVIAHYVGPEVDVSLHIEVEGEKTLMEAHDIETEVVKSIKELPEVDDVFVHVDPRELGEWKDEDPDQQGSPKA